MKNYALEKLVNGEFFSNGNLETQNAVTQNLANTMRSMK